MASESPDIELTGPERQALASAAGCMIPASETFGVPGADDPMILVAIEVSLERDGAAVRAVLQEIHAMAEGRLSDMDESETAALLNRFRRAHPGLAGVIEMAVARSYYADDRVLTALGLEPRAAYPKGHELETGDWAMLDPVRKRGPIYRPVEEGGTR